MASPEASRRFQRGAALLLAMLGAGLAAASLLAIHFADKADDKRRRNAVALAAAREALIGYAATKGNPPGSFPCPDVANTSGTAASSCSGANMIGRLPWKTIGLGDVRDADGECLWYAVSPAFKNGVAQLNSGTAGTLTIKRDDGAVVASQALAVVFSPGSAIGQNNRAPTSSGPCGGNTTAANYLDTSTNGINNASGNRTGSAFTFVVADRTDRFNDQLAYVKADDLFGILHRRIAAEIRGDDSNGLQRYYAAHGNRLPWASPIKDGPQQDGLASGFIPYGEADLLYPGSGWLHANGWLGIARYEVTQPTQARIKLGGASHAFVF